jgi:hypothetical protein
MAARFTVTAAVIAAVFAVFAVFAVIAVLDHPRGPGPPRSKPRGLGASVSTVSSDGACAGRGPAMDLHPIERALLPARWVFGPDVVVDPTTGRPTIAVASASRSAALPQVVVNPTTGRATTTFASAPQRGVPVTSMWSTTLRGSVVVDVRRISTGGKRWFPVPYNGGYDELERPNSLGIDAAGNQTALWREGTPAVRFHGEEDGDRDVYRGRVLTATRPAGGTWSKPTVLDPRLTIIGQTQLAVNATGAAVAVWVHERYFDRGPVTVELRLYASYRSSATHAWSRPHLVARDALGDSERDFGFSYVPQVGIDAAGNAVLMYERHRGRGAWVRRRDVTTGTWSPAHKLSDASPDDPGDSLAVSADGTATASLFKPLPGRYASLWLTARMRANGKWRAPVAVPLDHDTTESEAITVDGHGRALAVWRNLHNHNLMLMRRRPDGRWGRSTVLARAQPDPFGYDGVVRIAMNARGDVFVVWEAGHGVHTHLYGRYEPAGGPWTPVHRLTPTGHRPNEFAAAIGERGQAAVTWTRALPGTDEDPEYPGPSRTVWARQITLCS